MTGAELIASLQAQGFDYLSETECLLLLNDAYLLDICEQQDWPFLEKTNEGTGTREISDLRGIRSVIDVTQKIKLKPLEERAITDTYDSSLTTIGSPVFYYLQEETNVNLYPVSTTDTISVRYIKVPAALTTLTSPIIPTRYHSLIVDGAKARGYQNSDDYQLAQSALENFNLKLQTMTEALLGQNHDQPDEFIVAVDPGIGA